MSGERVLIVDDELSLREFLCILFERDGFVVRTAASAERALDAFDDFAPDLVISDLNMPGVDGIELLRQVKTRALKAGRDVPFVLITAYGSVSTAVAATKEGAFDYVAKPFNNDELRLTVRRALAMRELEADNVRLRAELGQRFQLGQFVGNSPKMQAVYALVRRVMGTRINCLIFGESGTGKELLARAVHFGSDRSQGPFVAVNCGAIPESLMESELFGYVKGAFTGANQNKVGVFKAAHGGTIFLDEVGEMPLSAQVKLLRVLQERKVVPVGGTAEEAVDVRIVAASNRDLQSEVVAGRFREDLYYRLNVMQIDLPPLRERAADIPVLALHFIQKFSEEYGRPMRGATPECLRLLEAYPFPGNVRELQNVIERAVALELGTVLTPSSLPERLHGSFPPAGDEGGELDFPPGGIDMEARVAAVERRYMEKALEVTGGNRTQAAKLLGITFRSFRYRLVKFGMDAGDLAEG
ncbi:MAG: sigma-54-dependent Fis family transcriptional regulator [Myxococcales bacterium]|nr:sigma-54-dependent Fis family transcriptional regulator [Myxococcales bacterium]